MCQNCDNFVHLHVHSEFSLLDGLSRIPDLAERAAEMNQPAIALTDHGAMYGSIAFYRACKKAGIKPIIGLESYVAKRRMTDMDSQFDRERFHALFLAQNQTGYLNLLKLASESQLKGYYYKPRVDHDFMAAHADGIISTSGCMAAEIPRAIDNGQFAKADELMGFYLDLYGKDNFFIELQEHSIPELTKINKKLIEMAPRFGLEKNFLLTNDVHYTNAADAQPHEVLLCIQTGSTTAAPKLSFSDHEYYLKSAEEMSHLFSGYDHSVVENAMVNSLRIADMCEVDLERKGYHLPIFEVPEGFDAAGYLRHLCTEGLAWRYGEDRAANDEVLINRLNHELNIITNMGFDTYFLIVWDLCEFARRSRTWWEQYGTTFYPGETFQSWAEKDIWWNVRGSGAGSVVAYSLGITGIDPIANALIFERFLNPGRVSMPDFDLDYPDDRRHEMVEYAMRRYGAEKVAQIITFGTMKARAAVRDVGRAMDVTLERVDQIARMIPAIPGKKVKIANLFDPEHEFYNKEFVTLYNSDSQAKELIDTAQHLEGVSRHASSHAAGVIIADKPLVEYVPLNRPTSGAAGLGGVDRVTQWDMDIVESMGLLKVDFLGLSTLTVLRRAARLIEKRHGVKYEMDTIPYDVGHVGPDPSKTMEDAFAMLGRGQVAGVFQVEGAGMRRLMMDMKPSRFDHIIAAISLYRPGPMENIPEYIRRMHSLLFDGKDIAEYHTPELEPILHDTYGIIVYQEQIIRMASELAGYEPGEADMLRRAVSKKKEKEMKKHHAKFVDGAVERGVSREKVEAIWEDIKFFARYGFNKSHAADYAVITCQTAFLKAHYPVEYMTALLSVDREKTEKVTKSLAEAKRLGIKVAPPDINNARIDFAIEDAADGAVIRFGFGAIKNAGVSALQVIVDERDANGVFADVVDLAERVDLRKVGSRALESMIKVGVFDEWGERPQFLDGMRRMINYSGKHIDEKNSAQMSLFGMFGSEQAKQAAPELIVPMARVDKKYGHRELLDFEKELIGVYLSEHPLERKLAAMEGQMSHGSAEIDTNLNGKVVRMGGMISSIRPYTTKKGDPMAFGVLEDLDGKVDLVFFPKTWETVREVAVVDQIVLMKGKVNVRDGSSISIIVESVRKSLTIASGIEEAVIDPQPSLNDFVVSQEPEPKPAIVAENVETDEWAPKSWDESTWKEEGGRERDEIDGVKRVSSVPVPAVKERVVQEEPVAYVDDVPEEPEFPEWDLAETTPAYNASPGAVLEEPEFPEMNGSPKHLASAQPPSTNGVNGAKAKARLFIVEVEQTGDWRGAMRSAVRLAQEYDGQDSFAVRLLGTEFMMQFPDQTTRYCEELANALENVSGVKRVYAG